MTPFVVVSDLVQSKPFITGVILAVLLALGLCGLWSNHFKGGRSAKVVVAHLLDTINLYMTGMAILLPALVALLIYYAQKIAPNQVSTTFPLVTAILFLSLSLILGFWLAFSISTQSGGEETLEWNSSHIWFPIFFGTQFILFLVAVVLTVWFLLTMSISVHDLRQPQQDEQEQIAP